METFHQNARHTPHSSGCDEGITHNNEIKESNKQLIDAIQISEIIYWQRIAQVPVTLRFGARLLFSPQMYSTYCVRIRHHQHTVFQAYRESRIPRSLVDIHCCVSQHSNLQLSQFPLLEIWTPCRAEFRDSRLSAFKCFYFVLKIFTHSIDSLMKSREEILLLSMVNRTP
jgi:hypothetical protein